MRGYELVLRCNPKHFSREEQETLLGVLLKRLGKHPLLSREDVAITALSDPSLMPDMAAVAKITRQHMLTGTTAKEVSEYLGTALESACAEGNLKGLRTRTEVRLGSQTGSWPTKKR